MGRNKGSCINPKENFRARLNEIKELDMMEKVDEKEDARRFDEAMKKLNQDEFLDYIDFRLKHLRNRTEYARIDELESIRRVYLENKEKKNAKG